ncbi:hypothetical protein MMC11_001929 [Xylographa trunciseda]|nr:hypothetical protein [Xylographa trunciseda]
MWNTYYYVTLLSLFSGVTFGSSKCINFAVPVTVSAETLTLAFPPFQNGYQAEAFIEAVVKRDPSSSPVSGTKNVTETFSISAQYCVPDTQKKSKTIQILTHGLGFDKSYWDFTLVAGNYSYVQAALKAGYSTFAYDRLGTGASTKADPYDIVQAPVELAILAELTQMLRSGQIAGCETHEKYVHVGHSFGSVLTNSLVAVAPQLSDGIILTGYSNNFSFQDPFVSTTGHLASENQPARFSGLSSGYITWADKYYNQFSFLYYPYFDPAVLEAAEGAKWPFTVGELITTGIVDFLAPQYKGPVLYLASQDDYIFCGGDCAGIIDGPYSDSRALFPAASDFEVYIQPNVGHGLNLHYNATGAYAVANNFFKKNGL